ncbi:hypothetical protein KVP10_12350 [Candidimonas humi]|uniref:Uncharacterized protein n=1 Tax=Candidimonas humi TaxID=683355 RepID=A0ABV8P1A9_9BURK|nr:hypothetical protein [Candidimonas humi]MBV6305680.1 hypothetical protein [Candidimonas humi]
MSSTPYSNTPSTLTVERFLMPLGKAYAMITVNYHEPGNLCGSDLEQLGFDMLDTLLRDSPFDQWEK